MWEQITAYFQNDLNTFILAVRAHIMISMYALMFAVVLAVPMGIMCVRYKSSKKFVQNKIVKLLFQKIDFIKSMIY